MATNGVVLYRGPSLLNGRPVVCVAVGLSRPSANGKTGDFIQTFILADDGENPVDALKSGGDGSVCGDCPHRPRDANAKKQLRLIEKLLKRDDIDQVVNACDAGREGELIFAYVYEAVFGTSPTSDDAPKPVERLWISSMTKQAIREGFERLRPGTQMASLEAAARSRSEADWLVGMNATRAATIRGRAWVGGVVSLGRVQTPTLALIVKREREIQAFVPKPYWLVHATFDPRYAGLWFHEDETRI